jgi:hypothetical protein
MRRIESHERQEKVLFPLSPIPLFPFSPSSYSEGELLMSSNNQTRSLSKGQLWAGRITGGLPALFLLVDGIMKLIKPAPVIEATVNLGYPEAVIIGIGIVLLASTILYLVPQTSVLGSILLTGYLGGAVATHVRVGGGWFEILFPVIFGVLLWAGLWLRDGRLQQLLPVRG